MSRPPLRSVSRPLRDAVWRAGAARLITLPLTAATSFATAAVTIDAVGADSYGYVVLMATLVALIPFADLGIGAVIQTETARRGEHVRPPEDDRLIVGCVRLLMLSGAVVVAVTAAIGLLGAWGDLVGTPSGIDVRPDVVVPLVFALFAASLPLSVGVRILVGIGRNDIALALGVLGPLAALIVVLLLREVSAPPGVFALAHPTGMLVTAAVILFVVCRITGGSIRRLVRSVVTRRSGSRPPVFSTAAPMFVIMISLPIALQSDRLIVAHQAGETELAEYAIAAQIYAALWGVLYSAGVSLWPRFVQVATAGMPLAGPWKNAVSGFAGAGAGAAGVLMLSGGFIIEIVSGGTIDAPLSLMAALSLLLVVQAAHLPSGMLLTTPGGLRFQAVCVVAMLVINVPASWFAAAAWGAAGPVIASVAAITVAQFVPGLFAARRFVAGPSAADGKAALAVRA